MALIKLEEAALLGLLPPEMMRFFPAVGRSQLFGSPLTLNLRQFRPGAGPLQRGVGRFGFQHGVPGIAGVRFGLGPLMQGLGLSPGPSAVTAPGVVPGGRVRAGAGGAPSAGTLAGRTQPQDIEAIRRLLESGQLDPRTLPPRLMAALLEGVAPRPTPTRAAGPPPPRAAAEPSGIAQPLAQAWLALTAARQAEQIIRATQGGVPPGSFAMTPETRAAFEAQRAGERVDIPSGIPLGLIPPPVDPVTGLPTESAFGAQIAAEGGAQGLRTIGIPAAPAVDVGEAGEVGVPLAGPGADGVPPTEGGRGVSLPSAGQIGGGLSILGAGLTAAELAQGRGGSDVQKALAAAGALTRGVSGAAQLAPATATSLGVGAGSAAGAALPYIGAALGIGQTIAGDEPAHIKALDAAAYAGAPFTFGLTALLPTIAEVTGLKKLFRGKPDIPHAVREARELQRHAGQAQGFAGEIQQAASLDELYKTLLRHQTGYVGGTAPQAVNVGFPGRDYLGLYGAGTIRPDPWTQEEFFQSVRERPQELFAGVQAGVRPDMLTPLNQGLAAAIQRQVQILDMLGGPEFLRAQAAEQIPPSPAAPAPSSPAPAGVPPLPSLQRGGVVPRGGAYRLEAGEVVIPAQGGRVIETRKDGNLYVPVDGGAPERAKKNPDPQRFWRVVMSSQEAQDAIQSGDPAETPILAHAGVIGLGPRKRAASLEFLRRAQHQNPAGTLGDVLAMSESIPPQAPTLPAPPPQFPMPRAFPQGLVPAGI